MGNLINRKIKKYNYKAEIITPNKLVKQIYPYAKELKKPQTDKENLISQINPNTNNRIYNIYKSIQIGINNNCKMEIITYEGLSNHMLKLWLTKLNLPVDNLDKPLNLVGQLAPDSIINTNSKYYD